MDSNKYMIRLEKEEDYRIVENLVREAFWNVYRPGCSEHYVIHVLRDDPAFVKELDFVMELDGKLIGQNMFVKTIIEADDGRTIPVLTMGPIGITPELKRKGYGKALLDYSLVKAAEMGFGAVLFEGNIDFYGKSGFAYALSKNFVCWYASVSAFELGNRGIRVLSLSPGLISTEMGHLEEKEGEKMLSASAEHRMGTPEELGFCIAMAADERNGYLTGVDILADGGAIRHQRLGALAA